MDLLHGMIGVETTLVSEAGFGCALVMEFAVTAAEFLMQLQLAGQPPVETLPAALKTLTPLELLQLNTFAVAEMTEPYLGVYCHMKP